MLTADATHHLAGAHGLSGLIVLARVEAQTA